MYSVSLSRPWWSVDPLAWVARITALDRQWVARGETATELDIDLRRLGARHGIDVRQIERGSWELLGSVVTITECAGHRAAEQIAQRAMPIVGTENVRPALREGPARS